MKSFEALPGTPRRRQESSACLGRQPDDRDGSPIPRPSHVGWTPASGSSLRIATGQSRSHCGRIKSLVKPNPESDRGGSVFAPTLRLLKFGCYDETLAEPTVAR
jgi:hypothetical protein